jgi:membrane protease YdiL (CAAX protease family)
MAPRSVQGNRPQWLSSLAAILIVVAATFVKVFPFSGHLLGAGAALAIARLQGQNGIARWFGRLPFQTVVLGAAACAVAMLVTDAAMLRWLPAAGLPAVDFSRFHGLRGDGQTTAMWIAGIWLLVGPTEELISRGFLIDQWSIALKGLERAPLFAVVASALTFGAVHFYEGTTGVITNVIAGLWLGGLYLQQQRTLWAVIIAHGIVDTVAMLAFFYGWL